MNSLLYLLKTKSGKRNLLTEYFRCSKHIESDTFIAFIPNLYRSQLLGLDALPIFIVIGIN